RLRASAAVRWTESTNTLSSCRSPALPSASQRCPSPHFGARSGRSAPHRKLAEGLACRRRLLTGEIGAGLLAASTTAPVTRLDASRGRFEPKQASLGGRSAVGGLED